MKYEKYSAEDMRSLIIQNEIDDNELTEEDYTAILDNEYCQSNINAAVIKFCVTGLQKFEKYSFIPDPDISNLIKSAQKNKRKNIRMIIIGGLAAAFTAASLVCAAFSNDMFGFSLSKDHDNLFVNYISDNTLTSSFNSDYEEELYKNLYDIPSEMLGYVPKYISENFDFVEAHLVKKEDYNFDIFFEKNDYRFSFHFHEMNSTTVLIFPKDDTDDYQYYLTKNNNSFEVFANEDSYTAIIKTDNKLLSIHSNTDYDTFLSILDEIPKI